MELDGDRLVLQTPPMLVRGGLLLSVLAWQRISKAPSFRLCKSGRGDVTAYAILLHKCHFG